MTTDATRTQKTPQHAALAADVSEQSFRLVRVEAGDQQTVYSLTKNTTVIGAAPECDIVVSDPTVSRRHCQVERIDGSLKIRDLGSTNGTGVDGVKVEVATLSSGSRVRVGSVLFGVQIDYAPIQSSGPPPSHTGFRGLVGQSRAMNNVFNARSRLAETDVTVLISGETGTGKSALARSIHMASSRRQHPFIVFDCSSVAPNLLDAALFGHEKGAFTGADRERVGAFESAGRGTLFLDELTELPLDLQPKLLRALEEREFKPIGSQTSRAVQCRIIAASQHDLRAFTDEGKFRKDLYYRLAVVMVHLPPLRERKEDIPLIVEQLLFTLGGSITPFSTMPEAVQRAVLDHSWPGNIRELRNYLERLTVFGSSDDPVLPDASPSASRPTATVVRPALAQEQLDGDFYAVKTALLDDFERRYLERLLERSEHNIRKASALSGIARRHLYDLLDKHGFGNHRDKAKE